MKKTQTARALTGKAGRRTVAVLMAMILVIVMIPGSAFAATKTYELGQPSGYNLASKSMYSIPAQHL